jgi:hypothetical protein
MRSCRSLVDIGIIDLDARLQSLFPFEKTVSNFGCWMVFVIRWTNMSLTTQMPTLIKSIARCTNDRDPLFTCSTTVIHLQFQIPTSHVYSLAYMINLKSQVYCSHNHDELLGGKLAVELLLE